jgi:hypothetical protein
MTDRSRETRDQIRRVSAALREHWDPIGGGDMPDLPADEYENYAPHIITLIRDGADDFKLVAHLRELERVAMGLMPSPPDDLLPVVRQLRRALG